MKRRVFSKTTPFHTLKKKRERAERCRFERHCSSFFFPPIMQRGRRKKGCFNLNFLPAPLSPGAHRPNTLADHPPRTYQKTGEGGRTLAVAPNGRPAGCSPCSTAKSHSLGSINNNQHSSNEEEERKKNKKNGGKGRRETRRREKPRGEKTKKTEKRKKPDREKRGKGRKKEDRNIGRGRKS